MGCPPSVIRTPVWDLDSGPLYDASAYASSARFEGFLKIILSCVLECKYSKTFFAASRFAVDGFSVVRPSRLTWMAISGRVILAMNSRLPTSAWHMSLGIRRRRALWYAQTAPSLRGAKFFLTSSEWLNTGDTLFL